MSGNVNRRGRRPRTAERGINMAAACDAWGTDMPRWVHLLATACDVTSQAAAAERIGRSGGYVSKLINNNYPGDMAEAEMIVRAAWGDEDVLCPLWGVIPLSSCMIARRRTAPPTNFTHRLHARHCPTCPNNGDRAFEGDDLCD
jgi:hypothetical protein